jgi:PAS domain S-box-containing protein
MVATLNDTIKRERKSEERYRRLIENIPDVVWTTAYNGKTIFISPNVEKVYGFTPDEIYAGGESLFFDRVHPEDRSMVRKGFESLFKKQMINIEYRIQKKDGTWIWLHDRSTAIYEHDGKLYADGIFSDITERKLAEKELRQFYSELEERVVQRTAELQMTEEAFRQANKKLNLLSSITRHDILNQLTILAGYLQLALDRVSDEDARKYIVTAKNAAEVIDRHMIFSRLYQNVGVHAPTWQNVSRLMEKVRRDLPREGIALLVETGDLELYADPLLEKVFFTLMENTLRHGVKTTQIRVSSTILEGKLQLIYEDNGIGISPHEKERIFEWGYGKHTGFGLFLSREILMITGLSMMENGEPDKGARFEITVPPGSYRFSPPPNNSQ